VWTMSPGGTGLTRLTSSASNLTPTWDPSSTAIAYTSNRDGNFEIYRMSSTGTNLVRLTSSPGADVGPAWGIS
jgi:Tol biopolymer transport system component